MEIFDKIHQVLIIAYKMPLRYLKDLRYFKCNFFPVALRPNAGHGLLVLEVSRSHITTNHIR